MELQIRNNTFVLLPQKALYWKERDMLLISDLHIGKIGHFRKAGIALPQAAAQQNFSRLDEIITTTKASQILFVGDLFHSDVNQEWDQFCMWRKQYPALKMDIVLGNHDRLPDNFCDEFQITIHPLELSIDGFTFTHYPRENFSEGEYVISGHVHPVISISGLARQHITAPCFYFGTQQAILPSFGYFTGGHVINIQKTDSVVAVVNDKLVTVQLTTVASQR